MASHHLNVLIDAEMHAALVAHAERSGVLLSETVRDILRRGLNLVASPREAGWYEGRNEAAGMVRKAIEKALHEVGLAFAEGR